MSTDTPSSLPWEALTRPDEGPPWEDLGRLAEVLATDESLLDRLWKSYENNFGLDPYATDTYECLYVPAVIALAATRLSEAARRRAADLLVEELVVAGDDDDDLMLEVLHYACGSLGAAAVPAVMAAIGEGPALSGAWFHLWSLMVLAAQSTDIDLRRRAAELCRRTLRRARGGKLKPDDVSGAAWTLVRLDHSPADRALLEELATKARFGDIEEAVKFMDGQPLDYDPDHHIWNAPVRLWLQTHWQGLHDWYLKRDQEADDDLDEEIIAGDDMDRLAALRDPDHEDGGFVEDDEFVAPGQTILNPSRKVGRNEPCPCGSGKKYKKCCGR